MGTLVPGRGSAHATGVNPKINTTSKSKRRSGARTDAIPVTAAMMRIVVRI
jgi:hypothetical protein